MRAVLTDNIPMTDLLLQRGADVNARSSNGNTPLYILAQGKASDGGVKMAEFLIDQGAEVNSSLNLTDNFCSLFILHSVIFLPVIS